MEVVLFSGLQLKPQQNVYNHQLLCRRSFLKMRKNHVKHVYILQSFNLFDFENLLRAFSMISQLSMISFQCLQVNLALIRLMISNHCRIFSNISAGKTSLIIGKLIVFSSAIFDVVSHCKAKRTC